MLVVMRGSAPPKHTLRAARRHAQILLMVTDGLGAAEREWTPRGGQKHQTGEQAGNGT